MTATGSRCGWDCGREADPGAVLSGKPSCLPCYVGPTRPAPFNAPQPEAMTDDDY